MEDVARQEVLRLQLAGLELQVRGRYSIKSPKYEDDDWVSATACCRASGAEVSARGLTISLLEMKRWCDQLIQMQETLSGTALLADLEQYLSIELTSLNLGHIQFKVEITPDHLTQIHSFKFEIDQSYLGPLIKQSKALLAEYPIHGQRPVAQ